MASTTSAGLVVMLIARLRSHCLDDGQILVASPLRRGIVGLLAARAFPAAGGRGYLRTFFLLRLFSEELMFQLFDFRLQFLDFLLELRFPPFNALELGFPIVGLLSGLKQLPQ